MADSKIILKNGGYECPYCGSRDVSEADKFCMVCGASFNIEPKTEKMERNILSKGFIEKFSMIAFISADK